MADGDHNADLRRLIRTIPDYPKPGIRFRDITTLLKDGAGFRQAIDELLQACACDFHGRPGYEALTYAPAPLLREALAAARGVDAAAIARVQAEPAKIAQAVHAARVHAVKLALARDGSVQQIEDQTGEGGEDQG